MRRGLLAVLPALIACGGEGTHVPPPASSIGSARVTWSIQNSAGEPLECSAVGVENATVFVTGAPVDVPCGSEQVATFGNLLAGPYAVTIQLKSLGIGVIADERTNVTVEAGKEAQASITFVIDPTASRFGKMRVRWLVNGHAAITECAAVGAETVKIATTEGSIDSFSLTVPCEPGDALIENLRLGSYGLLLSLQDSSLNRLASSPIPIVRVEGGVEAAPTPISFFTSRGPRARLFAEWTVNSSVAASACASLNADAVVVRAFDELEPLAAITASAACDQGSLVIEDIPPAIGPHRVSLQLYSGLLSVPPLPVVLTASVVEGVLFRREQTSTVSVDLRVR